MLSGTAFCFVLCLISFLILIQKQSFSEPIKNNICEITDIPNRIKILIDISPELQGSVNIGKWVALDRVITSSDLIYAYDCIEKYMLKAYKNSPSDIVPKYRGWLKVNKSIFYAPANDYGWGNIFVNNKAEKYKYNKYISDFEKGSIIVKESFVFDLRGKISPGPLFYMLKMGKGFNKISNDWKFVEVGSDGSFIETNDSDKEATKRCIHCHSAKMKNDFLFFLNNK